MESCCRGRTERGGPVTDAPAERVSGLAKRTTGPQPCGDTDELGRGAFLAARKSRVRSVISANWAVFLRGRDRGKSSDVARPRKLWLRIPGAPE